MVLSMPAGDTEGSFPFSPSYPRYSCGPAAQATSTTFPLPLTALLFDSAKFLSPSAEDTWYSSSSPTMDLSTLFLELCYLQGNFSFSNAVASLKRMPTDRLSHLEFTERYSEMHVLLLVV